MEPLRRKLNNNITAQSNSRRIGGGNELIKLGHKLTTELPRTLDSDHEKSYLAHNHTHNNTSLLATNTTGTTLPSNKAQNLVGSIISRAAAA